MRRFNQAGDDSKSRLWIIEQLAKGELLSEQQYFKLVEIIDEIDLQQLTEVIREKKIGQGMNFLLRKAGDLIDSLREWMQEFVENGETVYFPNLRTEFSHRTNFLPDWTILNFWVSG